MGINQLEDHLKKIQAPLTQKVDNAIYWIKLYLADNAIG